MSFVNETFTIENVDGLKPQSMWNADLGNGRFTNPILYADYSDPDAIRVGDDYFMIASSFCNAPGLPLLHSKDLVNWKVVNYIVANVPEDRYVNPIHGCGVWAPSIRYHEGTYFACFPMPDEGIYMSTTKDPFGTWSEPVNIRPGAGWIDPCPFWDEDGKAYLVAGVAKSRIGYKSVLHMVEMQPDGLGLIGEEKVVFNGNLNDQITIEGPKMYKRNGWYYIFAPAGGVKVGWQTVLRSRNVFGPYEYRVVMRKGDSPVNGPHQGAWVDTQTGEDWFLHFQDVYAAGRIIHLQPMSWGDDEWPIIGISKDSDVDEFGDVKYENYNPGRYGEPVMEYAKPNVGKTINEICEPATSDDFTGDKLGLQWQWNANPDNSWYECSSSGLLLKAVKAEEKQPICDVKNLLIQKWPAPEFTTFTKLDVSGLKNGDMAGVVNMGMRYAALAIKNVEGALNVVAIEGEQEFDHEIPTATEKINELGIIESDEVWFAYEVRRTELRDLNEEEKNTPVETVTISYSTDGSNFIKALAFESKAGRWVGVKNGIFCIGEGEGGSCRAIYTKYVKNV